MGFSSGILAGALLVRQGRSGGGFSGNDGFLMRNLMICRFNTHEAWCGQYQTSRFREQ